MRVALLLTGLARRVSEGYNHTWKYIIENYDTDIYLHVWKDEEYEVVSKTYNNVKSLQIQEPFKFTKYKENIRLPHSDTSRPIPQYDVMSCFRQLPMFYSWQAGYKPLYDSMINYDVVIRSRYDLGIHHSIDLNQFNMDLVNHSTGGTDFFDDNLCITNKNNSDILFYNIFDNVIDYSRQTGILNNAESTWTDVLRRRNLINKTIRHSILKFSLLRENKLWWGDENGNII
jgi:hypothetical protein